uniref:hypothetical protein n=1 Tax=Azospirillum argentinense TaxID=2970906 RepID=UPI0010BF9958|nr:hypothetical protein [Azospirillum argentinense]
MKVVNTTRSAIVSDVFELASQLAEERNVPVNVDRDKDETKGDLLVSIATDIGVSIAASVLYDLLKLAAQRVLQRNPKAGTEKIQIDGKEQTIEDLAEGD